MTETQQEVKERNAIVAASIELNGRGVALRNLNELKVFAQLAQNGMRDELAKSGLDSEAKIALVVEAGAEIGLPPMAALRSIAPIGGKPTIYGDAGLALVRRTGLLEDFEERLEGEIGPNLEHTSGEVTFVCRVKRRGDKFEVSRQFSVDDARRAHLWQKQTYSKKKKAYIDGPWITHPERMLKYKARAFALRDCFPDVLMGLHFYEEMEEGSVPEPAYDTTTPPRAERKPAEDVTITDAEPQEDKPNQLIQEALLGLFIKYVEWIPFAEDASLESKIEDFAGFCAAHLGGKDDDYWIFDAEMGKQLNDEAFTTEKMTVLNKSIKEKEDARIQS